VQRPNVITLLTILILNFILSIYRTNGQYNDANQDYDIDSLKNLIAAAKEDTSKIDLYEKLGLAYRDEKKIDSSILAYKHALELNEKNNYWKLKQCWEMGTIDFLLYTTGNYTESLQVASRELELTEKINDTFHLGFVHLLFGHDYKALGYYRESLNHYFKAKEVFTVYRQLRSEPPDNRYVIQCIGDLYLKMNQSDSALFFTQQAYKLAQADSSNVNILYSLRILGDIYLTKGDNKSAMKYYRQYIPGFEKYKENSRDLNFVYISIARIFQKESQIDSAIFYAIKALENAMVYGDQENLYNASSLLYGYYKNKDEHIAFNYFKIASQAKDSMIGIDKLRQTQILSFNEQVHEKEKATADAKEAAKRRLIIIIAAILISIISFLIWNRIRQLRLRYKMILEQKEAEKLKAKYDKELLALEARALRAQMNPHFVFNCLNSIKALMQEQQTEKGVTYLTTFSKLIRTLFNNADKKEISLFDEIETCKLYLQLEAMRFDTKISYAVNVGENIDLKSVMIPALIIQPFIENAIWHGIAPRNTGGHVSLTVLDKNGVIEIIIDDNGVGRETSQQNKSAIGITHQSKGVNLTQSRLELNNLLQQRQAELVIIDKKDENGVATGTTVIIKIKEEA